MTTVLVVDDEVPLVELVGDYLRREGYAVLTAGDGPAALDLARAHRPDLIILDLLLPGLDGLEVCRRLHTFTDAYVLMLAAKAEEVDTLVGLAVGADDYVTKPFSPRELVARVKALLRRPRGDQPAEAAAPAPRRFGALVVDEARHEVTKRGEELSLTAREFALLATLAAHPRRVFTRASCWRGSGTTPTTTTTSSTSTSAIRARSWRTTPPTRATWRRSGASAIASASRRTDAMGRLRANLRVKLFLAHLLVIVVGVATLLVAAQLVAPAIFADHLAQMQGEDGRALPGGIVGMGESLQGAFRAALLQALLVAAGAAGLVALLVSLFVSRRIVAPIRRMLAATGRIATGRYAERVPVEPANRGDELGQLAASFNAMASALEQDERRRLDLLGDVAHELRTPIATLEGYLEGLLDGVVAPSPALWGTLHGEAGRLRRLVDDLRELSRAEARQLPLAVRPVPPVTIVAATLDRLRAPFAERGLTLDSDVAPGLPPVLADPDRAIQVLTNLLSNALRYTPAPGRVAISVERTGDAVTFRVSDTGIGFAPGEGARLFERFYRADKSRSRALGGAGVGLTIARALVEAMGGELRAVSPGPGQGSTFTLPLAR